MDSVGFACRTSCFLLQVSAARTEFLSYRFTSAVGAFHFSSVGFAFGAFAFNHLNKNGILLCRFKRSRCVPPAKLTGKRHGQGVSFRACLAFSGLPIRPPTYVGALSLTRTPESMLNASKTLGVFAQSTIFVYHIQG